MIKNKRGFTLVEIVIVVGILGMIMLVIGAFQRDVFVNSKFAQDSLSTTQDSRNILRMMVRELRTSSSGNDGSYPLISAATSTISFYSDVDADGLKDKVRYYIATSTLTKGLIKPTGSPLTYVEANEVFSILAYNLRNSSSTPLFEYYDNAYAGTSSPLTQPVVISNVRLIKINLMIDVDPNRSPNVKTYTSQVN
ncbi:type II secretion system protein, partial [bacterium]|nr:type II secretion system protein [bacterium]